MKAYINRIATAVPAHDVHATFVDYVPRMLENERDRRLFTQMVKRAQIDHRYSVLKAHPRAERLDDEDFYIPGQFPDTQARMQRYKHEAFTLARQALDKLDLPSGITHLIITTCTGFYAPGLDLQIIRHYGLSPSIERTTIGFMGCQAAINGLKAARHIVRSEPTAQVLMLNLELCTLHLQETAALEEMLSFLIFADGCAASIISAEPHGLEMQRFSATLIPQSEEQITWHIGREGFDMVLSGKVPATIIHGLSEGMPRILGNHTARDIQHWAVHPGGRSVLDAVRESTQIEETSLRHSRQVLREHGNMSSATVMFVLKNILDENTHDEPGCAMAFGPGVSAETMLFQTAANG